MNKMVLLLILFLQVSSADNLLKQVGPRSRPIKHPTWSGSNLFDTLMVFLREFFEKVKFENSQQMTKNQAKLPSMQRVQA